mmetsp:Transcript_110307/g.311893  ORF Transcript_110307/g.311893 Transcript_110307/m.311893 type:complete len:276 (+) Transcript_110307:188-1015(+)
MPMSPCNRTASVSSCRGMLSRLVPARSHRKPSNARCSDCLACLLEAFACCFTTAEIRSAVISLRWMYSSTTCSARGRAPETGRMPSAPSSSSLCHTASVPTSAIWSSGSSSIEGVTTSSSGGLGAKLIVSQNCSTASLSTTAVMASIPFNPGKLTSACTAAAASASLLPSYWQDLAVACSESASRHRPKPHACSSWLMICSWATTSVSCFLSSPSADKQCTRCCLCCASPRSASAAWYAAVWFFPSPPCTARVRLYMAALGGCAGFCGRRGSVGH